MNEFETRFKSKYPTLWDFMETSLWPDVDGNNQILLLHQIAYFDDPTPAQKLVEELKALSTDNVIQGHEIASLFNQAGIDPPYQVVNPENAKAFCHNISESLAFIISLRK
jgi:hypothetical protein